MPDFSHEDLQITWNIRYAVKPATKKTQLNPTARREFTQPPYKQFYTCKATSVLQEDVPLTIIESPLVEFTGSAEDRGTEATGWKIGWMQIIHSFDRTATYTPPGQLFLRIHPKPVRDVTTDESDWPFSDDPCDIRGVTEVTSSDEPFVYLPSSHPQVADSKLTGLTATFNAVTVLACYRESDHTLVVLGGYRWSVDFGFGVSSFTQQVTPKGEGFSITMATDSPQVIKSINHLAETTIWGTVVLSLSKDDAFDHMQESFDGVAWNKHNDHSDDEGSNAVSWTPRFGGK